MQDKEFIFEEKDIYYVNVAKVTETTIQFDKDKITKEEILKLKPEDLFANSYYANASDEEDCIKSYEFRPKKVKWKKNIKIKK